MLRRLYPSGWLSRHHLAGIVFLFFIFTSAAAALGTKPCSHPDERDHLNGFLYFEGRWWPPDVNTDGIYYNPYGNSRVYSMEIVYPLYANLIYAARQVFPALIQPDLHNFTSVCAVRSNWMIYRLLNVALFALTLGFIWRQARQRSGLLVFGLVLTGVPQVVYIFSYANSDAWSMAVAAWLTVYLLSPSADLFQKRLPAMITGLLAGLIIVAKPTFWFVLPFCCSVLLYLAWGEWRKGPVSASRLAAWAGLALVPALLVALPYRVGYPLSQGDFGSRLEAMWEARARDDLKHSPPLISSFLAQQQKYAFEDVALNPDWWEMSFKSGYGYFGYMSLPAPPAVYWLAGSLAALWLLLAGGVLLQKFRTLSLGERWLVTMAPVTLGMVLFASLYNSVMTDYQPQGRYLFAALLPLAFVLLQAEEHSPASVKKIWPVLWAVCLGLSAFVLWSVLIIQP